MIRIIFNLLFTFIVTLSLNGQIFNENDIYGHWFLFDSKSGNYVDTMIFKREMADSSFNRWSFNKNDTLSISSGYTKILNDYKYEIVNALSQYKWSFEISNDKKTSLILSKNNKIDYYSILFVDDNNLKITFEKSEKKEKSDNKLQPQKIKYYFMQSGYDSTVFDMDTLILSVKRPSSEFPRIEFYQDSIFCFFYNVELDTISDKEKGLMMVIEKSDKINGSWNTNNFDENIRLILNENRIVNYSILSKGDFISLIKQQ
jgi:hypothetical protein